MNEWRDYGFTIGMPHMVPDRLSEVELFKVLGDYQWMTICALLGTKSRTISNTLNERLYASFICIDLGFPASRPLDSFEEGTDVFVKNRVNVYGNKFLEGLFVFDSETIPADVVAAVKTPAELCSVRRPWATMVNAFVARAGSNSRLKVFEPAGLAERSVPRATRAPVGIAEHEAVQATGHIPPFDTTVMFKPLVPRIEEPIAYPIMVESDLNGAGLLYFARYVAIMNYGERVFLSQNLRRPFSSPLIASLSTERRRIYYFVNADPSDVVRVAVSVSVHVPDPPVSSPVVGNRMQLLRLAARIDMYRASDQTLMASSLVHKSLNVPASEKPLCKEVERLVASLE